METVIFCSALLAMALIGSYLLSLKKPFNIMGFLIIYMLPFFWLVSIFAFELSDFTAKASIFAMIGGIFFGVVIMRIIRNPSKKR